MPLATAIPDSMTAEVAYSQILWPFRAFTAYRGHLPAEPRAERRIAGQLEPAQVHQAPGT